MRCRHLGPAVLLAAGVLLAACSSSGTDDGGGTQDRTLRKATGLPAASDVTRNGTAVTAGNWAVVSDPHQHGGTVFAIKATAIAKGTPGDLRHVQSINGAVGVDLKTATPYYISFDYAVLRGDKYGAPQQQLTATATTTGDSESGLVSLSVPDDLEHCDPPGDYNPLPPGLGYEERGCVVAVGSPTPAYLRYDINLGSTGVRIAIPAG